MSNQITKLGSKLEKAVLVVAHPDDEILWFSSIVESVRDVIVCFEEYAEWPELGGGRRQSLEQYPLKNIQSLKIDESNSFLTADWYSGKSSDQGMRLFTRSSIIKRYNKNYVNLINRLGPLLSDVESVVTHNPWGEYGHEEHVQVYSAIKELQTKHGFQIFFSSYFSDRSRNRMSIILKKNEIEHYSIPTNKTLAAQVMDIYKKNDCWTWNCDYVWPDNESLLSFKGGATQNSHCSLPLQYIHSGLPLESRKDSSFLYKLTNKLRKLLFR